MNKINFDELVLQGWKEIEIKQHNHYRIREWLEKYAEGQWQHVNGSYFFEKEKDATIFKLRWS